MEDHLDHIHERLDHYEMVQRKNAIRVEVDELRKTVLNLLIANHNDTVAVETAPRGHSTVDRSFFVAMGASLAIIVVLSVIIVALLCHNRRLLTSAEEALNDIEMARFYPNEPVNTTVEEPEPELQPESSEEEQEEEEDEQPRPLFLIGAAAIHFSQRPSALDVVRGFELPAPIASPDSDSE